MNRPISLVAPPRALRQKPGFALSLCCAALLLAGCESTDVEDDEGDDEPPGNILLLDEHNYQTTASLSIPVIETASAENLEICWDGVISDLQCHDVDPLADLDNVVLVRFQGASQQEVQELLGASEMSMQDVDAYFDCNFDDPDCNIQDDETCVNLEDMSYLGDSIPIDQDYVEGDEFTYVLLVAEGTTPGVGTRSMVFLQPKSEETNTRVDVPPACTEEDGSILDFSATFSSETVRVPMDGPWVVDWSDATRDGAGNPISFSSIDSLLLGFYKDMTLADLQDQIFDFELLPASLWEIEHLQIEDAPTARTADLAQASERHSGEPFPGFERDEEGFWLLGLMCSTCQNPAPIMACVLEPAGD
jgi:hypothetical protein